MKNFTHVCKILASTILFLAIWPARFWSQSITVSTPVHNLPFNRALPLQTWECSEAMATLGTHMVDFLDTNGTPNGYVDCHGLIHGAGGATPGEPPLSLQGASADGLSLVGIPHSAFDASTGLITLTPADGNDALYVIGGSSDNAILTLNSVGVAGTSPGAVVAAAIQGILTDDGGHGTGAYGLQVGSLLHGSNVAGSNVYGVRFFSFNDSSGGAAAEESPAIFDNPLGTPMTPPVIRTAIHIKDQNPNGAPASATNAALLIDDQTAHAGVYAIKTGLGPVSFGDAVSDGIFILTDGFAKGDGYQFNCSDCDTPITSGEPCTTGGDGAGAQAFNQRGTTVCL